MINLNKRQILIGEKLYLYLYANKSSNFELLKGGNNTFEHYFRD